MKATDGDEADVITLTSVMTKTNSKSSSETLSPVYKETANKFHEPT